MAFFPANNKAVSPASRLTASDVVDMHVFIFLSWISFDMALLEYDNTSEDVRDAVRRVDKCVHGFTSFRAVMALLVVQFGFLNQWSVPFCVFECHMAVSLLIVCYHRFTPDGFHGKVLSLLSISRRRCY